MIRRYIVVMLAVTLVLLMAGFGVARAEGVSVRISKQAVLVNDGQAVNLTLAVSCPAGSQVLEAFVYVVQDGNQSNFGSIPVTCDSRQHRLVVQVTASLGAPAFHEGAATASAFVLVLDPATGLTETGQDNRSIRIR